MAKSFFRKTSAVFIISFIILNGLVAQTEGPKTLLWKISGNGMAKESWLFGTMHILPEDQFISFPEADHALSASSRLVLEINMDVPFSTQKEWAKQMLLPEGTKIPDFISPEEFSRIRAFAIDSLGMNEVKFNLFLKMKPFVFYSAFLPEIIGEKISGYEQYFTKIAKKNNIPLGELESFYFQMGIFDSIPNEKQMKMFFEDVEKMKEELHRMISLYINQDIYAMAAEFSGESTYKEFEEELLILRNKAWVPGMKTFMQEGPVFFAVGAGHLAGEYGLIKLLREDGFTLEPVLLTKPESE